MSDCRGSRLHSVRTVTQSPSVAAVALCAAAALAAMMALAPSEGAGIMAASMGVLLVSLVAGTLRQAAVVYAAIIAFDVYLSQALRVTSVQVFQLATVGLTALAVARRSASISITLPVLLTLAWVVLYVTGAVVAVEQALALRQAMRLVLAVSGFFLLLAALRDRADARRCLAALVWSSALMAAYGLLQFVRGDLDFLYQHFSPFYQALRIERGSGVGVVATFANQNILSGFALTVLPLALAHWRLSVEDRHRWAVVRLLPALAVSVAVVLSFSKMGWLLLGLEWCVMGALMLGAARSTKVLLFAVPCLLLVATIGLPTAWIDRVFPRIGEASVTPRLELWGIAVQVWQQRPDIGFGPEGFSHASQADRSGVLADLPRAHSHYLQLLIEVGFAGVALYALLLASIVVPLVAGLRHYRSREMAVLHGGVLGSILAYLAYGVTDALDNSNQYLNLLWLVLALGVVSIRLGHGEAD